MSWPSSAGLGQSSPFGLGIADPGGNGGAGARSGISWGPIWPSSTSGGSAVRGATQALPFGLDVPAPVQALVPRLANPNIRTIQLLTNLIERLRRLKEVKANVAELSVFALSKAPNAGVALRLQAVCDQRAAAGGPQLVAKLAKAKKPIQDRKQEGDFFTELLIGFPGLQRRIADQSQFFETFAATLEAMRRRQQTAHDLFRLNVLEELTCICATQTSLRHKLILLVGCLEEMASAGRGYGGDELEETKVAEEYEELHKQIGLQKLRGLRRSVALAADHLEALKGKKLNEPNDEEVTLSTAQLSANRSALEDLMKQASSQHAEIEAIKLRIEALAAETQNRADC